MSLKQAFEHNGTCNAVVEILSFFAVLLQAEFMDSDDEDCSESHTGTWQNFLIDESISCKIKVYSSRDKFKGMLYDLYVQDKLIPVATRDQILKTERNS